MNGRPPSRGRDGKRRITRMTALALAIRDLADRGMTTREIGVALGRNKSSIARVARWHGVRLQAPNTRSYRVTIGREQAEIIRRLSTESNMPEPEIIARIVRIITCDGIERARKRLGKEMGPK
jgi:IS30 family transposase